MKRLYSLLLCLCLLAVRTPARAVSVLIKSGATSPIAALIVDSATGQTGLTSGGGVTAAALKSASTVWPAGGSAFAAAAGTFSEIGNGVWAYAPTSAETGGGTATGLMYLHIAYSGAQVVDTSAQIVAFDPNSATNLGLSALPTVNAGAAGGLPKLDASGFLQVAMKYVTTGGTPLGVDNGNGTATTNLGGSFGFPNAPVPSLAQIFAQPMQGGLTFLQTQNLQSALLYDATRSVNGAVTTLTWFARKADTNNAGNTLPDLTKPVMVKTTTYSNALLLSIVSQAVVIYPANLN